MSVPLCSTAARRTGESSGVTLRRSCSSSSNSPTCPRYPSR
nr:MAG TPA: hypothetical protein [Caudoviricetes sp.]